MENLTRELESTQGALNGRAELENTTEINNLVNGLKRRVNTTDEDISKLGHRAADVIKTSS